MTNILCQQGYHCAKLQDNLYVFSPWEQNTNESRCLFFLGHLQTVHDVCQMHVAVTGRWFWSYQGIKMDLRYELLGLFYYNIIESQYKNSLFTFLKGFWDVKVWILGPVSTSDKTSHRKISWSLEAARLVLEIIVLLWNLTGTSAALLPRCLSNFKKIVQFSINSRGFGTSRDLKIRSLIGYWIGALVTVEEDNMSLFDSETISCASASAHLN